MLVITKMSQNTAKRSLVESRRKAILDYNTDMLGEREEGRKEGIELGVDKRNIETAIEMKKKGFDISDISEISHLSIEEIEKL